MNLLSVTKYLYVITQNFMLTNDVLATKLRKIKYFLESKEYFCLTGNETRYVKCFLKVFCH